MFKSVWFGAIGEGSVLSPKAPCGLCAGDGDPHAGPVLHLRTYFTWFISFRIQHAQKRCFVITSNKALRDQPSAQYQASSPHQNPYLSSPFPSLFPFIIRGCIEFIWVGFQHPTCAFPAAQGVQSLISVMHCSPGLTP